ncbi:MAG: signal peptidase II [Lentisphaerae bacterium]|nr:signal peptidase II [Lentisphaerota bacterium]
MLAVLIGILVAAADQATKHIVCRAMTPGESVACIPGFLNLTYLRNTGAVFGSFQYQNERLVLLSFLVLFFLAVFYRRLVDRQLYYKVAVGLMLGGIVGNLGDRIKLGWVTDFVDVHLMGWHWPAFNLADSAICVGVIMYGLYSIRLLMQRREDSHAVPGAKHS